MSEKKTNPEAEANPSPDQAAAHDFFSELRTRICTQPLPYQDGVEARALESLWEVFSQAREIMKKHPGCREFANQATEMLNVELRPFTAKWHRAKTEGRLNSRDGADEFRGELAGVQGRLRDFAARMSVMAYGPPPHHDRLTRPAIDHDELIRCFQPIRYGIPAGYLLEHLGANNQERKAINASEHQEIVQRRRIFHEAGTAPAEVDAAGLALSGGGIRSAIFSLGVVQVLADRGLLRDVDLLSTVSGGGYTGCFLSRYLGGRPEAGAAKDSDAIGEAGVGGSLGPDPAAIRHIRLHAEYLSPVNLKVAWSMVTATLAGLVLNWTVPLLVIVITALIAGKVVAKCPPVFWKYSVGCSATLTLISMVVYAGFIRGARSTARIGAWILGIVFGSTLLLCMLWALVAGYTAIPKWIEDHWLVSGGLPFLLATGPAIIRFVPVLKTPAVRKMVLQILLWVAGLVVPVAGLALLYTSCYVGSLHPGSIEATNSDGTVTPLVYLSYARQDTGTAARVNNCLTNAKVRTFFGTNATSQAWSPQVGQQISQCSVFLSLISSNTEGGFGPFIAERNLAALQANKMPDSEHFYFPIVIDSGLAPGKSGFTNEPPTMRFVPALWCPDGWIPDALSKQIAELQARKSLPLTVEAFLAKAHGVYVLAAIALFCGIIAIFVLNINLTAPHRLYRDCLAKTFIHIAGRSEVAPALKDINPTGRAPYHLINATLNLPNSETAALRDRKCDFFLFSKYWCGSSAIGYQQTDKWHANSSEVDLATAMAVSGAAVSSYMGLESKSTLTSLLTVLNVRLGFWIPKAGKRSSPGFRCLLQEMFGFGMTEKASWFNLSDGGNIENMAIYELLRRRCKYIVCVDGEADPLFTFQGLMTLVRHAQIDFGIRIEPKLDSLRPDSATEFSQTHAIFCRIFYPQLAEDTAPQIGLLLYIKLSVTGNESELIRRYRTLHPEFPHQSTLDQFFDQEQFEAYRQLGAHIASGLFSPALRNSQKDPTSVSDWFRQLAPNLLEPEGS